MMSMRKLARSVTVATIIASGLVVTCALCVMAVARPGAPSGAGVVELALTPKPASGDSPLTTTFAIDAKLTVPIQQWLLVFDDGSETSGAGTPPATVQH